MRTIAWAFPIASVLIPVCIFAADFSGSVLDGDTIEVLNDQHPERIRLSGIDCPEKGQAIGQKAKPPRPSPLRNKSRSRPMAMTLTSAPLETCSCRMERTSFTRWITKRYSVQEERALGLQLNRQRNVLDQQIKQQVRHVEATLAEQCRIDLGMSLKRRRA